MTGSVKLEQCFQFWVTKYWFSGLQPAFKRVKQTRKHPSVFYLGRFMNLVRLYTHTRKYRLALKDVLWSESEKI